MKILHLNSSGQLGGAGRSAARLHRALSRAGVQSHMLDPPTSQNRYRGRIDRLPLNFYPGRERDNFSLQWLPNPGLLRQIRSIDPDVVHFHWVCLGWLPVQAVASLPGPIVWTLHDSWPFTGGCHVPGDCERFKVECQRCPQLNSRWSWDLSGWSLGRKRQAFARPDLFPVAPSQWLARASADSHVFARSPRVIPHGLDLNLYQPQDMQKCRRSLGLPSDQRLALFISAERARNRNKGADLLIQALYLQPEIQLITVGPEPLIEGRHLGLVQDEKAMAEIYGAADLLVLPSRWESFSLVASEALACGRPVVAFGSGGQEEVIEHKVSGFLAEPHSYESLAQGLDWVAGCAGNLVDAARLRAERFYGEAEFAANYISLYEEALNKDGGSD